MHLPKESKWGTASKVKQGEESHNPSYEAQCPVPVVMATFSPCAVDSTQPLWAAAPHSCSFPQQTSHGPYTPQSRQGHGILEFTLITLWLLKVLQKF